MSSKLIPPRIPTRYALSRKQFYSWLIPTQLDDQLSDNVRLLAMDFTRLNDNGRDSMVGDLWPPLLPDQTHLTVAPRIMADTETRLTRLRRFNPAPAQCLIFKPPALDSIERRLQHGERHPNKQQAIIRGDRWHRQLLDFSLRHRLILVYHAATFITRLLPRVLIPPRWIGIDNIVSLVRKFHCGFNPIRSSSCVSHNG